ncbi:MAG: nuclear transport factor 2 family protein [Immundisolibacteraceae bacterium]|nr:nuclear transport factor 2 family protein [Immundisolibacteraceae bacterium]
MTFKTVLEAHAAFYQALELADLQLMTEVWQQDENISCIHPLWAPLFGSDKVMPSWKQLFTSGRSMSVEAEILAHQTGDELCIHLVREILTPLSDNKGGQPILATNSYQLFDSGWKMVLHHASPTAVVEQKSATDLPPGNQLH